LLGDQLDLHRKSMCGCIQAHPASAMEKFMMISTPLNRIASPIVFAALPAPQAKKNARTTHKIRASSIPSMLGTISSRVESTAFPNAVIITLTNPGATMASQCQTVFGLFQGTMDYERKLQTSECHRASRKNDSGDHKYRAYAAEDGHSFSRIGS
jgi:hypothetical protein